MCKDGAEVSVYRVVWRPDPRAVRIALALAEGRIGHPAACRLSLELDAWLDLPAGVPDRAQAVERGVPQAALARARRVRDDSAELARSADERAAKLGARIVTLGEAGYPEAFGKLDLPPPAIWIAGDLPDRPAVALVGARRASRYGLEVAGWLARECAAEGVAVVSGFALGVDAAAHRGALAAPDGRTVAVLGCGLDVDYPLGHRPLAAQIRERGALLTEFAPGRPPRAWRFPVRNRLIVALARAVGVVEAAPRSGSLVTARIALELGRELLAVPGRLTDELALGPNALLADGAAPILVPADLLDAAGLAGAGRDAAREPAAPTAPAGVAGDGRALWLAAAEEPRGAEALAAATDLPIEATLVALLELELGGHLRRSSDGRYAPR